LVGDPKLGPFRQQSAALWAKEMDEFQIGVWPWRYAATVMPGGSECARHRCNRDRSEWAEDGASGRRNGMPTPGGLACNLQRSALFCIDAAI
jgi:hypothetical protein